LVKFSSIQVFLARLQAIISTIWEVLTRGYRAVWGFLQVRVPFIRALVKRHTDNPSTIFVDLAVFVLALYVIFGFVGYVLVYPKKSESRAAETLSVLYPLPAAKVNNSFVWSHKFLERLRFLNTFNSRLPQDASVKPPTDAELRQRVLEGLIEDQIVVLEAKKRGLRVTEEELDKALEKQGDISEIKKKINELYGMSLGDFKAIIAEQVLKEKLKNTVLTRVRLRHILVTTQQVASEAKRQVEGGRDFADVAKEFSQDATTKDAGGDLGYWRKGELNAQISPGFEEAVFALPINQLSEPVQSPFGFHIIQVTERDGDNLQTYEEWYRQTSETYRVKRYIQA
jgi:foldase protein PrsA